MKKYTIIKHKINCIVISSKEQIQMMALIITEMIEEVFRNQSD
jgi:hypothetical protein